MRVIICGAGQVGYNIAAYLAREDNDITVLDIDPVTIAKVNDTLDVKGIVGSASSPEVLSAAGAGECDLILAVTRSDETNMIACQVAHSLFNVPKKLARIRNQDFLEPRWANLFSRAHMPIDVIISPEQEVARAIERHLTIPGTTNVLPVADGKAYLCGVICEKDCPVVNTQIKQIHSLFPGIGMKIVAIFRGSSVIIPDEDDQMQIGDEAYFVTATPHLKRALAVFGHEEKEAHRVLIIGGGNIGLSLARLLRDTHKDVSFKMIEKNQDKALELRGELEDAIVIRGDALEKDILEEANIAATETAIVVTNDDEANILTSLLAKQYGCTHTITLVTRGVYSQLLGSLGVGTIVSPRAVTVSSIMQYVRRGRIKAVHNIRDGLAEVMESEISETSDIANKAIRDMNLPGDILIGAVIREDQVLIPDQDFVVRPHDIAIIMTTRDSARNVEKMLSVQVDLF